MTKAERLAALHRLGAQLDEVMDLEDEVYARRREVWAEGVAAGDSKAELGRAFVMPKRKPNGLDGMTVFVDLAKERAS
jgi:hypothetical protein